MICRKKQIIAAPFFALLLLFLTPNKVHSQRYLADIDSSFFIKDTVRPVIKRFENLRITGYIQPQFQKAQSDGSPSFSGGNFSQFSSSRFMLRRARVKIDYVLPSKSRYPKALFSFQIDATERGVIVRDMFLKLFETKNNVLSMTAGLFARPFGYEVNLSSAFRETPERGRMSQILMPGERDIGIMFSYEPQEKKHKLSHIKVDIGFFNGQGLSGTTDFDDHKDLITRLFIKPYSFNKLDLSGGVSYLRGGWKNGTKYVYESGKASNGDNIFVVDSSMANLGKSSPRHYYGADAQLKLKH
ncbi:MAG: porin, partial [Bacteroidota bacterium]